MANPFNNINGGNTDAEASFAGEKRRKDVILQNITPGHHCVTDKINGVDLYFEPFGVMDLTWFDTEKIKRSTPLQKSLIDGYLVPITREEHDAILYAESQRQREDALNSVNPMRKGRTKTFEIEGREIEAEVLNLSKVDSSSAQASITSAGQSNDPTSFSIAFNRARKEYAMEGKNLTAQTFHKMTLDNTNLVKSYLRKEQADVPLANTVYSGTDQKGRFFVAGQPGQVDQFGQSMGGLKKFQQGEIAAQGELYRTAAKVNDVYDPDGDESDDEAPLAGMIDLSTPDDSDDISGGGGSGVRRL